MNKLEQAARQALEALIKANHFHDYEDEITALREALAEQAEQEPVAWMVTSEGLDGTPKTYPITGRYKDVLDVCDFGDPVPLYAAPVQPVKQEPVAWVESLDNTHPRFVTNLKYCSAHEVENGLHLKYIPLYTAPVDAKAIRAEALEEAAKWLKESGLIGSNDCAAAIRGLK